MAVQTHSGRILQFTRRLIVLGMTLTFATLAGTANAANLTLAWDANSEPDLAGYLVFCGESSGNYTVSHEITSSDPNKPPLTTCEFTGLDEGKKYYFTAIAFSDSGQSDYSQEISYTVPVLQEPDGDGDGFTVGQGDCNDGRASVHPGAEEICGDGIDQDCDGSDLICADPNADSDGDGLTDVDEINTYHSDPQEADTDGDGVSDGDEVAGGSDPLNRNSKPVDTAWHSAPDFSAVHELGTGNTGIVETNFDVTPFINNMDGIVGYADSSFGITGYNSMAMLIWVSVNGRFEARNGGVYDADVDVPYAANNSYHVRMVSDLGAGTYDVWVTPEVGTETQIANDYIFRSDVPATNDLGKVCLKNGIGEFKVENHTVAIHNDPVDPNDSDDDGDGYSENQGDCNDINAAVNPGAADVCGDGIDQDCSGADLICPEDSDDDRDGYSEVQGDCNDGRASVHPGAEEICGDGIDQDCDGSDLICADPNADSDGDGLTDVDEINTYHSDPQEADTDGDGVSDGDEVAGGSDPLNRNSKPVDTAWHSAPDFSAVHELGTGNIGIVETNFDVTPFLNNMDGIVGYADSSFGITGYNSMAMLIWVSVNGRFEARNGGVYDADVDVPYAANNSYHVRMVSDLGAGTYDVWVTPEVGTETQIANDYIFRSDAPATNDLGKVCLKNGIGEFKVENHTVAIHNDPVDPNGVGDSNTDYRLIQEAEDGDLYGGFEISSDPAASGGRYVHVPNGTLTSTKMPNEGYKIDYNFNVTVDGMYRIKGSVYAASGSDDSYWVKVNDSPGGGYLWDVLRNTGYQQDYVNDRNGADPVVVWLPAGENTVTVYLREDGTRLDRIELELVE